MGRSLVAVTLVTNSAASITFGPPLYSTSVSLSKLAARCTRNANQNTASCQNSNAYADEALLHLCLSVPTNHTSFATDFQFSSDMATHAAGTASDQSLI
jgi:hypothetical protein